MEQGLAATYGIFDVRDWGMINHVKISEREQTGYSQQRKEQLRLETAMRFLQRWQQQPMFQGAQLVIIKSKRHFGSIASRFDVPPKNGRRNRSKV